jgi:transcriptional regulator with XRE-family HTH domain
MSADQHPADAGAGPTPECTLARKINYLFETLRRPDGKPYSNEEVAESINERGETTISGTYLWYLRRGDRDNPTKKHLEVLARFFDVSPAFFFDDHRSRAIAGPSVPAPRPADNPARRVAVRLDGLSPRSLHTVAELIDRVRELEGLPARDPSDDPST